MTRMIGTIAALALTAVLPGSAQIVGSSQGDQARQRLEELRDRLQLTPDQVEQVRPVITEEMQKLNALREKSEAGSGGRRDRVKLAREAKSIQHDADDQLKKILSKTQMKELETIRKERRAERSR